MPKPRKLVNGRGSNPNSHGNHRKLNPAIRKEVWLTPEEWETVKNFGNKDNYSTGVAHIIRIALSASVEDLDILFAKLPHLGKAKLAIQLLLEGHDRAAEYAEAVLIDLEDLEIEHLYEEAYTDGVIEKTKKTYIV